MTEDKKDAKRQQVDKDTHKERGEDKRGRRRFIETEAWGRDRGQEAAAVCNKGTRVVRWICTVQCTHGVFSMNSH